MGREVADMEYCTRSRCCTTLFRTVFFSDARGAGHRKQFSLHGCTLVSSAFFFFHARGNGLRRDGREDDMIRVHQQNGFRPAAERRVEQHPALARLLHDALDGGRVRADDSQNPPAATALPKPIEISFIVSSAYSMFCVCSRIFSSSALSSTTVRACSRSLPLEPMVFDSRLNSCSRKSSLRPMGPPDVSI